MQDSLDHPRECSGVIFNRKLLCVKIILLRDFIVDLTVGDHEEEFTSVLRASPTLRASLRQRGRNFSRAYGTAEVVP